MNFSSRLPRAMDPNALTLLLEAKRRAGEPVLDLTESNPTRAGIEYPAGFLAALADPLAAVYEPEPFGLPAARELIAAEYDAGGGENVAMTASTSEAYSWLFKLLCDPGDEVLIPRPSYPLFDYLAALESISVRHYGLFYDHGAWCIDFHTIERALHARTRAVVVVNPNNPTGHFIARHELRELRALCADRGVAMISDEVFRDYAIAPRAESVVTLGGSDSALTFTLHGLSKAVGLPQMKLAWMVVSGERAVVNAAMPRLEMIADTYLSAATPVQCALPSLLALRGPIQEQIVARLKENLQYLRSSGLRVLEVEAGWYATVTSGRDDDFAELLLRSQNVLVQPGYFYDFEDSGSLVLSLLTRADVFREGVSRLRSELG
ncbi:MAG TPA: pyridoxal phosphate-dependent aminotransferase [Bryobacteraceae bacterium]